MKRYIARFIMKDCDMDEIKATLQKDDVKIDKHLKYLDVFILLSENEIPNYSFLANVQEVDQDLRSNNSED